MRRFQGGKAAPPPPDEKLEGSTGAYPGFSEGGGGARGGGGPRSAKEANKPNKRATGLKPLTCAHQGSMFRPIVVFVLLKVQFLRL